MRVSRLRAAKKVSGNDTSERRHSLDQLTQTHEQTYVQPYTRAKLTRLKKGVPPEATVLALRGH